MKRIFQGAVLCVFLFALLPRVQAAEEQIQVKALPDQTTVTVGMMFLVKVQVLNQGEGAVDFWANTCSFEKQWEADQAGISIQPWTCRENGLEEVQLKPQEVYEKNIMLYITQQEKTAPLTFRLGFKRMTETGDMTAPVWSDPVTVRVLVPGETAVTKERTSSAEVPTGEAREIAVEASKVFTNPAATIYVRPDEIFSIVLDGNPTTGFSWVMSFPEEEKGLKLLEERYKPSAAAEARLGASGKQIYTFQALKPGQTKVRVVYRRPWVPSSADTREVFTVVVQEN